MIRMRKFNSKSDNIYEKKFLEKDELLLFHGSPESINRFRPGVLFLTDERFDAIEFARGAHMFGQYGRPAYLYTVEGERGKTYDADDIILAFIMEEDHEWIPNDFTEDLDTYIENLLAPRLRDMGYRYFIFKHPSNEKQGEINVYVSLYPDKDLGIFDKEEV